MSAAPPLPPAPPAARWPWPPLVQASVALHAGAAALAFVPGQWPLALGAVLADQAVLTAAGLWPRSALLGPNVRRLPAARAGRGEIAITIDDGPDPQVTPRVLDQLDAADARATFFCIAARAAAQPALLREIVRRGHAVQNHSHVHRHHFALLGPRGLATEIGRAQAVLAELTGRLPHCFRAPAGLRNPLLDPVLHRLDLHLVSWTRRGFDTRVRDPARVLQRLTRGLAACDILLLHDGNARRGDSGQPVIVEVLPALLQRCRAAGLHTVTLDEALARRGAAAGILRDAPR